MLLASIRAVNPLSEDATAFDCTFYAQQQCWSHLAIGILET